NDLPDWSTATDVGWTTRLVPTSAKVGVTARATAGSSAKVPRTRIVSPRGAISTVCAVAAWTGLLMTAYPKPDIPIVKSRSRRRSACDRFIARDHRIPESATICRASWSRHFDGENRERGRTTPHSRCPFAFVKTLRASSFVPDDSVRYRSLAKVVFPTV